MMTSEVNHRKTGHQYEQIAADYLAGHGFSLIEKNFFCRSGEIDLIMKDKETLVFVEVKYRKNRAYGHAAEAVTPGKAKKLIKTAFFWLKKQNLSPYTTDFRFDIVAIHQGGADIDWFQNAITQE
jgi:putative endonuclease